MEKLCRALVWISGIALACGLFVAFMFQTPASNPSFQGPSSSSAGGFAPTFFGVLTSTWFFEAMRLSGVLTDGATVLGIATAWVGRRRNWLVALLVMTFLVWLWPTALQAWQVAAYVPQMTTNSPSPLTVNTVNSLLFAVPLIPVVMSLVLALSHRRLIPSVTTSTDAELGIVRSRL